MSNQSKQPETSQMSLRERDGKNAINLKRKMPYYEQKDEMEEVLIESFETKKKFRRIKSNPTGNVQVFCRIKPINCRGNDKRPSKRFPIKMRFDNFDSIFC